MPYRRNALVAALSTLVVLAAAPAAAAPVTDHPRIWLRPDLVQKLRTWAVPSNPMFAQGLNVMAQTAKTHMDTPQPWPAPTNYLMVRELGTSGQQTLYIEDYAFLFAFMAQVSPDPATRDDYAQRARTLLMHVIDHAKLGQAQVPFRFRTFAIGDRSRWAGQAFPATVDWIYPYLSAQDKADIATVFHRWSQERLVAYNHPEPLGVTNDPVLLDLDDPARLRLRLAGNNYAASHMRNLCITALALDPADDPPLDPNQPADALGNTVRSYLGNVTGAWLYVQDYLYRHDALGGLNPEGFEYFATPPGSMLQVLWALRTSGNDDPAVHGPQVVFDGHPYFEASTAAFLHQLPQSPVFYPSHGDDRFQPAWYGDGERYFLDDDIRFFGYLALLYEDLGRDAEVEAIRWLQLHTPPGGADEVYSRARALVEIRDAMLYFMLFDPNAPAPADPRSNLPTAYFGPGLGRMSARTAWDDDASLFTYEMSWSTIDHQFPDAMMFNLHRKGEWLTKESTGYGAVAASSDYHNTLAIQNTPLGQPWRNTDFRSIHSERGSQFIQGISAGDPELVAHSFGDGYTYATGDATNLYNTRVEPFAVYNYTDVAHASRSILWLQPDHLVIYDRAASHSPDRFKRFWMSGPGAPVVDGNHSTFTTAGGQHLFVSTLLPAGATHVAFGPGEGEAHVTDYYPAYHDPMTHRLMVEAPGNPVSTRFLHVLQGADAGDSADAASHLASTSGTPFEGAVVQDAAVLFRVDLDTPFAQLAYTVPNQVQRHWLTGLEPNSGYDVAFVADGAEVDVTVTPGTQYFTDAGGLLVLDAATLPSVFVSTVVAETHESGGAPASFRIHRSGDVAAPLLVHFTVAGRATPGVDHDLVAGSVTLPAGSATVDLPVHATADGAFEGKETVELRLAATSSYHATLDDRAQVTVLDDDPPTGGTLRLAATAFAAVENAGQAIITLERIGATSGEVAVRLVSTNGSATNADFTPISTVVTWADGDAMPKQVQVPLIDDSTYEGDESFSVHLNPYSVVGAATIGSPDSASVTVADDDPAPIGTVRLDGASLTVAEDAGSASIVVRRVDGSGGSVSIDYATTAGTATAGVDFTPTSGTLTWADGESGPKSILVPVVSDAIYEGATESFSLALSNPQGGVTLGSPATISVSITDDDPAPAQYDVGDGQPYPNLASVPWHAVGAGSTVRLHWRAEPYREKILLSGRGTDTDPVRLVGVAGPNGERPILDGDGATTSAAFDYANAATASRSLIAISRRASQSSSHKPGEIEIEGLELRHANRTRSFTTAAGVVTAYHHSAAAIRIEGAEHVRIRDCVIHDNGNGIVSLSDDAEATVTRDVLIEANDISNNGTTNDQNGANVSLEAVGVVLQHNRLGSPLLGSGGSNAKGPNVRDRSASTLMRYNWIEGGGFLLDLVESTESGIIRGDAGYGDAIVYGNVLRHAYPDGSTLIRFGGDSGVASMYRTGTLHFFHNTVTMHATQALQYYVRLFRFANGDQTADVRNNIFYRTPGAGMATIQFLYGPGSASLGRNWISSGWLANGSVTYAVDDVLTGSDPGFVAAAAGDLHLTQQAAARDFGGVLSPAVEGEHAVLQQIASPYGVEARLQDGTADLGAFEYGIVPTPTATPTPSDTPEPTSTPTWTATDTPTPEPTATATPTMTSTPTDTPEPPSPTDTATPEPTATPTWTATDTPEPTATATPASTDTPEPTSTPTFTATPTPFGCVGGAAMTRAKFDLKAEPYRLTLKGEAVLPKPWSGVDPVANGMRLEIGDAGGLWLDVQLPGGTDGDGDGWHVNPAGTKWTYLDPEGSFGGIVKLRLDDKSKRADGLVRFNLMARGGAVSLPDPDQLRVSLFLGDTHECVQHIWTQDCAATTSRIKCR